MAIAFCAAARGATMPTPARFSTATRVTVSAGPSHTFGYQRAVLVLGDLVGEELVRQQVAADAGQVAGHLVGAEDGAVQPRVVGQVRQFDPPCDVVGLAPDDVFG